jgi:hypothetical protein
VIVVSTPSVAISARTVEAQEPVGGVDIESQSNAAPHRG